MANQTATKCLIGEAKMNWVRVFEPEIFEGTTRYSVTLTFPKSDTKLYNEIQAKIAECAKKAEQTMFGGKLPKKFTLPAIKDGDEDFDGDSYEGMYVIKASSAYKPEVVKKETVMGKKSLVPITDEEEFYSGCYGFASVTFAAYSKDVNKGISCQLNSVLKTKDGERFAGKSSAADDFSGLLDDLDDQDDCSDLY